MHILLLSGGSGKRLWPLSNEIRSKQFLKLFPGPTGEYQSMVQRMYQGVSKMEGITGVTVATSKAQLSPLYSQLGRQVDVCIEPCRRDTFPAIALAAAYLRDVKEIDCEETVVICPVDPYVQQDYFEALADVGKLAQKGDSHLVLMGITPTYPSEKYGYILPQDTGTVSRVSAFIEKPDTASAREYIRRGALWNGGVFGCKLGYLLQKADENLPFTSYTQLSQNYQKLTPISFDYAVVEKEKQIQLLRFCGAWKDLGTWNTLTEAMEQPVIGKGMLSESCRHTYVVNELDIPILCMGLKDMVVSASPQGILVSDLEQSSYMKPLVEKLDHPIRFAEKSWGSYRVLDVQQDSMTIKVTLHPGHRMQYHSHRFRDEIWNIVSGQGTAIVDGKRQEVGVGDAVFVQAGCRHTLWAKTQLVAIEVQMGKEISADDKQKYEWEDK